MEGTLLRERDIRKEWGWIRHLFEKIRIDGGYDWKTEDVYAACLSKDATLLISDDFLSIVVCHLMECLFTGEQFLFVWLASGEGYAQKEHMPQLIDLAQRAGASFIRMETHRKGFERIPGWTKRHTTYDWRL